MNQASTITKHPRTRKRRVLPSAIVLALMASAPGYAGASTGMPDHDASTAQAAPSGHSGQTNTSADQDQTPANQKAQDREQATQLGTITVTATGRAQKAITVPYNISVVTGDKIEQQHIVDNAELFRSIPGINVVDSGPRNSSVVNNIRIRGVNVDSSAMGDYAVTSVAPVATYVDTVPLFANFLLFDIDRVEVLRGPQGTLYGSGSLGGTVRYLLNKPQLNEFHGSVGASGSSAKYSAGIGNSESAVLNIPMGSTMALRIDGKHNDFPGVTDYVDLYRLDDEKPVGHPVAPDGVLSDAAEYYTKKDADTVRQDYGRIALRFKPSDAFDATLSYMAQNDRFGSRRGQSLGSDTFDPPHHFTRNEIGSPQLEPSKRHVHLTSLEANVDMGFATLTSSTSYFDEAGAITSDNTGFYANNAIYNWFADYYYYPREMHTALRRYRNAAFTQELRLVSQSDGPFDYIAGLYYRNQNTTTTQDSYVVGFKDWWDAVYAGLPAIQDAVLNDNDFHYVDNGHYREVAAYGQGVWHATEALSFTLGARYFRDRYVSDMHQNVILYTALHEGSHAHDVNENHKALFLGNMSWWFTGSSQLYATVSQGYRRGGANAVNLGTPAVDGGGSNFTDYAQWLYYKPDTITNYEVGLKGRLGRTSYTVDVFDAEWKHAQLNTATTYGGYFAVQNLGKARSRGLELAMQGRVGDHFSWGAGYTYTDAVLREDAYTPDAGLPSRTVPGATIDGFIAPKGTRLPGVSKNRVNAYANYTIALGTGAVTLHADGQYQSAAENSISQNEQFNYTLPGFTMWNASASYNLAHWSVIAWMKNIGNTKGATGIYKPQYMGALPSDRMGHYKGNSSKLLTTTPRTVGVTVRYLF